MELHEVEDRPFPPKAVFWSHVDTGFREYDDVKRLQVGAVDLTVVVDSFSLTCSVPGAQKDIGWAGCLQRAIGKCIRSIAVCPHEEGITAGFPAAVKSCICYQFRCDGPLQLQSRSKSLLSLALHCV